jgi:hypothetical protein
MDQDTKMKDLVVAMQDVFEFVDAAEPLEAIKAHDKVIRRMTQQTTECGYFIYNYAKVKNLCTAHIFQLGCRHSPDSTQGFERQKTYSRTQIIE